MHVMHHNWSARKQRLHLQSAAGISRHSVLSEDRIQQCETSSGSRHKDTDQCLQVAIFFCRHRSVPVQCENGSAETIVAEGGQYSLYCSFLAEHTSHISIRNLTFWMMSTRPPNLSLATYDV